MAVNAVVTEQPAVVAAVVTAAPVTAGNSGTVFIGNNPYEGAYNVTPTRSTQTLLTAGLLMKENVTVNPIPKNYGLITWNGSALTVS